MLKAILHMLLFITGTGMLVANTRISNTGTVVCWLPQCGGSAANGWLLCPPFSALGGSPPKNSWLTDRLQAVEKYSSLHTRWMTLANNWILNIPFRKWPATITKCTTFWKGMLYKLAYNFEFTNLLRTANDGNKTVSRLPQFQFMKIWFYIIGAKSLKS